MASYYTFTYYYGNGDSYLGYASFGNGNSYYFSGQILSNIDNDTGSNGYYIIGELYQDYYNIFDSYYENVYIESYYDSESGYLYEVNGFGQDGLGSESGEIYNSMSNSSDYFDNYSEYDYFSFEDDYAADPSTTGVLSVGGSVTGVIDFSVDYDWFKIYLEAGNQYEFNLNSYLIDSYLVLYDGNGTPIAQNDDSYGGLNSSLIYTAQQTGYYYLEASDADDENTGSYEISATLLEADIVPDSYESNNTITLATSLTPTNGQANLSNLSIHNSSDVDWFSFNLVSNADNTNYARINFINASGDLDLELYNSDSNLVDVSYSVEDQEEISLNNLSSGTYFLKIYGYGGRAISF